MHAPAPLVGGDDSPPPRPGGRRTGSKKPFIAVVGRPNVGKSTIANRLTKKFAQGSLVFNEAGITRDRTYADGFWGEHEFTVVDTGGIVFDDEEDEVFLPQIRQQAMVAMSQASAVLLVVDGQSGRTVLDEQIATFLRRQGIPVVSANCSADFSPTLRIPCLCNSV